MDGYKKVPNVQLQEVRLAGTVGGEASCKLLKSLDRQVVAFASPTGVGIENENRFPDFLKLGNQYVMHDAISKIRRENLPQLRFPGYICGTG